MKLILESIKALFRKLENSIASSAEALTKEIAKVQNDAKQAQITANDAKTVAHKAQTAVDEKETFIYIKSNIFYQRQAPLEIGDSITMTITKDYEYGFHWGNNPEVMDIDDLSNFFSYPNGLAMKLDMYVEIAGKAMRSVTLTSGYCPFGHGSYYYKVHGFYCDDEYVYKVSVVCDDGATVTITRIF